MPFCPHCHKFTSFSEYGIDNILEGEEAEEFYENESKPVTPEQIARLKECVRIYREHPLKF
jgi:hypothetical protein